MLTITPAWAYCARGIASWYSEPGNQTASTERFHPQAHTCAMLGVPFDTIIRITSGAYKSWCRVNDHGPYVNNRLIDLTPAVRDELHFRGLTTVEVCYRK